MGWSNFLQAVAQAYSTSPSTGGSGTPSDPAAPAPAPAPGGSGAAGSKRKVKWAPDFSTFIFEDEHPDAVWQDSHLVDSWEVGGNMTQAGFYNPQEQAITGEWHGGGLVSGGTPSIQDLQAAGLWDFAPDSDLWRHLEVRNPMVARAGGDVQNNPEAFLHALSSLYGGDPRILGLQGGGGVWDHKFQPVADDLIDAGFEPEVADAFRQAMFRQAQIQSNLNDHSLGGMAKDALGGLGEIMQVAPIRAAMLAMSLGGSGLFGELGAAGSAAGELGQNFLGEELLAGAPELAGAFSLDATTGLAGALPTGGMLSEAPGDYDWLADKSLDTTLATRAVADPALAGIPISPSYLDIAPDAAAGATQEPGLFDQMKETYDTVSKYGKVIKEVEAILGSAVSEGAPQRREGQGDAEYAADLAEYMNLDNAAMAEMGLQPGSPEYMQYILEQADAIIAQITQGLDVDADDLSEQLRTKTEEEMIQLRRALYVRGTLEQMMGSGTYTDPFSGTEQEVTGQGMFNPNIAAYQRGIAGSVQDLARTGSTGLNALLNRESDLFGMQARADERFEEAKLEDDIRKRRGMLS